MLPPELQSLLDQIDACEHDAEQLVADLDDDTVNQPPRAGGWSVAQCLEHLALMNEFYLRGWQQAVNDAAAKQQGPFKGLRPTPLGRWFARSLEPPVRMKGKAIKAVLPGTRFTATGIINRYKASHDAYRHLVRSSAAVDVNRIVRPNAIVNKVKMRLATVLLVIPAHDRRHLWQARNVALHLPVSRPSST
jgi:hypothetical protein